LFQKFVPTTENEDEPKDKGGDSTEPNGEVIDTELEEDYSNGDVAPDGYNSEEAEPDEDEYFSFEEENWVS
jgi:hypothetical protein